MTADIYKGIDSGLVFRNPGGTHIRFFHRLTAGSRALPSVLLIGAQKAGTTSLFSHLIKHPQICAPVSKEIFFFNDQNNYQKGLNWYRAHFPLKSTLEDSKITLDGSANYFESKDAPARIKKDLPGAKLILLLRNPVDRAYSHYKMAVELGFEKLSFQDALAAENDRLKTSREHDVALYGHDYVFQKLGYRSKGVYIDFLTHWLKHFPLNSIKIIDSRTLHTHTEEVYGQVLDYIGLSPFTPGHFEVLKKSTAEKMPDSVRRELHDFYEPHNEALFKLIGKSFLWQE
ncbi:MAG: sulfotransferase domain-containing protein [Flavobacteriales bacterium]|nr:sulfotransferase domain-containing protein [Flavobacteriales bacterium]